MEMSMVLHIRSFSVTEVAELISDNMAYTKSNPANRTNSELVTHKTKNWVGNLKTHSRIY